MAFQGSREIELHQGGDGEGSGEGSGVALYTAAHSNKAQNTGAARVMIWLGANSVLTRIEGDKEPGGKVPRPVRIRSIRSEMARTSEARACI